MAGDPDPKPEPSQAWPSAAAHTASYPHSTGSPLQCSPSPERHSHPDSHPTGKHEHQVFFWNIGIHSAPQTFELCGMNLYTGSEQSELCPLLHTSIRFSEFQPFLPLTFSFPPALHLGPLPSCVTSSEQVD